MTLDAALREHFGFAGFRRGQREACEAALAGRDVLVVMPTGSGKSLCYQLPALMRDDLTIVVSPLVALMQDQVEALAARGLAGRVGLVNAQRDSSANAEALRAALAGRAPPALRGAGALRHAGFPRADGHGPSRPVRGGRGALRLAVGPRLPARLLPAGRRRPGRRSCRDRRLHRHGHPAGGSGRGSAAGAARPAARGHRLRPPQHRLLRGATGAAREARARGRGPAPRARTAGDRLCGHARGCRGSGRPS